MKGERRMTTGGRKGERERELIVISMQLLLVSLVNQTRRFLFITGKI